MKFRLGCKLAGLIAHGYCTCFCQADMCWFFPFQQKNSLFSLQSVVWCSDMSTIVTFVFNVTIGWFVNKGRDVIAKRLREGDVAYQEIYGLIVREIEDIKSKVEGLARKDLLTALDFFQTGLKYLFDALNEKPSGQASVGITDENLSEHDLEEAVRNIVYDAVETRNLEEMDFNETMKNFFSNAKERFKKARTKATGAFNNEALKIFDRITAARYRVMATVLESVVETVGTKGDMSPSSVKIALTNALPECEECLKKLHSLPAVQDNFKVELDKTVLNVRGRYGKDKRRAIISTVCQVNRTIYNAARAVGRNTLVWPTVLVDPGKDKVDPLRDGRISKVLHKVGKKHWCVPWSFGQEGEEEHKLKDPRGIAINTKGQFLIADNGDKTVKVFDSNGKFDFSFKPQTDDADTEFDIWDVATSREDDKIYLLVKLKRPGAEEWEVQVFNKNADLQLNLQHKFPVRRGSSDKRLTVSSGKILLLTNDVVHVHEPSGGLVCTFGEGVFKEASEASDITATCDGRVMIVDSRDDSFYLFDVEGHQRGKFVTKYERGDYYCIACHLTSEHVVLAGDEGQDTCRQMLAIYTVNGDLVGRIQQDEEVSSFLRGITVTVEGHIAVALRDKHEKGKVIVV